jgi:hypothetical protein
MPATEPIWSTEWVCANNNDVYNTKLEKLSYKDFEAYKYGLQFLEDLDASNINDSVNSFQLNFKTVTTTKIRVW